MIKEFKNKTYQGNMGLGAAIAYYTEVGNTVSIPLTDSSKYDLIVEDNGDLKRVQCKTTFHLSDNGSYIVNLVTSGGNSSTTIVRNFDNSVCDYVFIATAAGLWYSIPSTSVTQKTSLTLSKGYDKYIVNGELVRQHIEIHKKPALEKKKPKKENPNHVGFRTKIDWPPVDEILDMLKTKPYKEVGKELGVSDVSVRKHLTKHGINPSDYSYAYRHNSV